MTRFQRAFSCGSRVLALSTVLAFWLAFVMPTSAQNPPVRISVDNLTNSDSDHKTEVEPSMFAWGNTIVTAFHVARRPGSIGWGSGDIGFSTSTDGGKTWHYGDLPGLTVNYKNGTFGAAADPSVAYDAKHGVWLISTLPLVGLSCCSAIGDVAASRSTDGLHWGNPVNIDKTHLDDKNWTVCDNTPTSPFYGNCYTEWDQAFGTGDVLMSVSKDGGKTWGPGLASSDHAGGLGGEPLVQPNGTVIVPFQGFGAIDVFSSTNGGVSWGRSQQIAVIDSHLDAAGIRNPDLPSAAIDGAGNVYVLWSDCRFRKGCAENDIVMSSSADGKTWSAVTRVPIDATNSTVDHFLPGIGGDPTTSGTNAHLTIVYYYYPNTNCSLSTCQLDVGFTTSTDGGGTWTAGTKIAGPMKVGWLPVSDNGPMVADYIGVSYSNGNPFGVFAGALAPSGTTLNEAMYTTKNPLPVDYSAPRFSSINDHPVPNAHSDHAMKFFYDDEGHREIPRSRQIPNTEAQ